MRITESAQMVLAGDIGGTNARLRLYERKGKRILDEAVLPSRGAASLSVLLREYLSKRKGRVVAAVLGVAGPVVGGVADVTNLPWKVIDERKLSKELRIPKVLLINDLAAGAVGCARVHPLARKVISKGKPQKGGNIAVIAAGTGLGQAGLVWDGSRSEYVHWATEGGHCDYAPTSDLEVELWSYLRSLFNGGHVSIERALSGPGLGRIYDFFVNRHGGESLEVAERLASGDRNANIATLGLAKASPAAADAVDLFARIYGTEAGNLTLKSLGLGGVYLLGRIAATIIPRKKAIFLEGMRYKGRMGELLARVPVTVVTDRFVGLTGAGYLAARLASQL
jgi:glucokinase